MNLAFPLTARPQQVEYPVCAHPIRLAWSPAAQSVSIYMLWYQRLQHGPQLVRYSKTRCHLVVWYSFPNAFTCLCHGLITLLNYSDRLLGHHHSTSVCIQIACTKVLFIKCGNC